MRSAWLLVGVGMGRAGEHAAAVQASRMLVAAQLTSQLQVPLSELRSAPLLANQQTPSDYDNYIATRTDTWKAARERGNAPAG